MAHEPTRWTMSAYAAAEWRGIDEAAPSAAQLGLPRLHHCPAILGAATRPRTTTPTGARISDLVAVCEDSTSAVHGGAAERPQRSTSASTSLRCSIARPRRSCRPRGAGTSSRTLAAPPLIHQRLTGSHTAPVRMPRAVRAAAPENQSDAPAGRPIVGTTKRSGRPWHGLSNQYSGTHSTWLALAPATGLEPVTVRLTVGCSAN